MGSVRKGTSNHRGILMSAPMILAYQKGWECMTRRTRGLDKINVRPDDWVWVYEFPYSFEMEILYGTGEGEPVGILKASDIIKGGL